MNNSNFIIGINNILQHKKKHTGNILTTIYIFKHESAKYWSLPNKKEKKNTERITTAYKIYKCTTYTSLRREENCNTKNGECFTENRAFFDCFTLYAFYIPPTILIFQLETCLLYSFQFSLWRTLNELRCIHFVVRSVGWFMIFPKS